MIAVTKLINILDKPFLKYWANKIGLNGVDLNNYEKNVRLDGDNKHFLVERYLKENIPFDGCEMLKKSLLNYKVVGVEKEINNSFLCGRVDLLLKKDNKIYVVDLKRNKRIYLSTKLQLSTYKHIINADYIAYMNLQTFEINILNIRTDKYYEIIKRLYQIQKLLNELNEKL